LKPVALAAKSRRNLPPTKIAPDTYGNCNERRGLRNQINGAVMNSQSTGHDSSDAPSTSSGAQTPPAAVSADAVARAFANADASASSNGEQNSLWPIVGAMAIVLQWLPLSWRRVEGSR
jgi:hypothetical protein